MTRFETLFGIRESDVKETCVLMPLLNKSALSVFGIDNLRKGVLYASAKTENFTLINTGIGAAFAGDAALYLSETACRKIILFGSCGLVNHAAGLNIGSLVMPKFCHAMESFSDMLLKKYDSMIFRPDRKIQRAVLKQSNGLVSETGCATLGSLKLEEDNADLFLRKKIDIVEMECSGVFSAADIKGLKAAALFYVSDIIKKSPFYSPLRSEEKSRLSDSIKKAANLICEFTKRP
ncbi:MAG: hypothetical protein WC569_02515 [Candidatus Omnitrophota bacterium]